MDDYVCSQRDYTGTTIVVLDGVSGGSDDTPKFVEAIADKLKTMSMQVLMDNQGITRQGLVGI